VTATWTAAAEAFAEDIREPGFRAAGMDTAAWRARVDPAATRSIVQAAVTLTDGDARRQLWGRDGPVPDGPTLLAWCEELEAGLAGMLRHAQDMAVTCAETGERAESDYAEAREAARRAEAGLGSGEQAVRDAAAAEIETAEQRMKDAADAMSDCEAALEILAAAGRKLAAAANCMRQVPDDIAETYKEVADLIRRRGIRAVPYSGDFLTRDVA
jgi:hypothetical protein